MTPLRAPAFMRLQTRLRSLGRDDRGAAAIEFALLCGPFVLLMLLILQMGIFYMAQTALNLGVVRTAETLRDNFMDRPAPTLPAAGVLKSSVATKSGNPIKNDATLLVEIRRLPTLAAGAVAITDGVIDYGASNSVLVLRAQSRAVTFFPGFATFGTIRSSAVIRRQEL